MSICIEVVKDAIDRTCQWFWKNVYVIANTILFLSPYGYMYLASVLTHSRGYVAIGGEQLVPVVIAFICGMSKGIADKLGKGIDIPVPVQRFTETDSDGEVRIPVERSEELILYIADLEDWLEKQGVWSNAK